MEFIDRKKEIDRLSKALRSKKKRFIVMYGRRRLGKSTLIKKVLAKTDVYFEADLNEPLVEMQLLVFSDKDVLLKLYMISIDFRCLLNFCVILQVQIIISKI